MSEWDFGYGREPTEHHEPQYPQQPPYSYPEQQESEYPYYPADQSDAAGWPGADGHPAAEDAYDPPTGYPITYERDEFEGRTSPAPAPPPSAARLGVTPDMTPGVTPPYSPWPDAPDPGDRFEPEGPAHQRRSAPSIGERGAADSTQAWYPGRQQYPDGSAYSGLDRAGDPPAQPDGGWPRGAPPPPQAPEWRPPGVGSWQGAEPWRGDTQLRRDDAEPWREEAELRRDDADPWWGNAELRRDDAEPWRGDAEPWRADAELRRDDVRPRRDGAEPLPRGDMPWPQSDRPWPQGDDGEWGGEPARRGRWLIPAALAVAGAAVGAAVVMFALGQSSTPAGPDRPTAPTTGTGSSARAAGPAAETGDAGKTPLTLATARSVLAGYTSANNRANARRNAATLATVETGGSYAIDTGLYTVQAADGAAPYAAFAPVTATYYIPRAEPAGGTRWFVVQVGNAFLANPKKVTSTEYLLFTQAASGGAWLNAVEPYLISAAHAPQVAVSGDGLATAVSPTATSLAIAPGQLAARTAAAIDGTGAGLTVADLGALADLSDQTFWRGKLPTATVTDAHAAATGAAGQTFALRTTNGGALVFYTDAADLQITPPAGSVLHLTVPGFYSDAQGLSRAGLSYLDQFAAADPPAGAGTPRVVAEYSGITGKS